MSARFSWLRPWLVPTMLIAVAVLLTAPWSYLVLRAAYNRDVTENAKSLARRVEENLDRAIRSRPPPWPLGDWFPGQTRASNQVIDQRVVDTLSTEMKSDATVQTAVFYAIFYDHREDPPVADTIKYIALVRTADNPVPTITERDLDILARRGTVQEKTESSFKFTIPWKRDGRVVGVTYVELSRDALSRQFWNRELPLLLQVMAWTATGVIALSVVGIFAYSSWQRAGTLELRAELSRQGMLAERGLTAAVLAHEIRNPLAALRFQLHSLRKNAEDPERITATAQTIDGELLRIQQLVSDYLAHERGASLRVQSVDLADAAHKLKTLLDELLRETGTRLTIVPPPVPGVHASCDPHALRQILMNLVLNAQQAMGTGGSITIRIDKDPDGFGTIDVSDTGPGIPEEMRERLFKPFQTSKREGHGIGLALVKRFVDNFGGSVSVETEAGKGTTFHLKLPLADGHSPEEPPEPLKEAGEAEKIGMKAEG